MVARNHHHHTTTVLRPLFRDHPGEPVAKRELLDFMVLGKINRGRHTDHPAGCHSIRTKQYPPPPSPHFKRPDALSATKPTVSKHWRQHGCKKHWCKPVCHLHSNSSQVWKGIHVMLVIMAALHSNGQAIMFYSCGFFFLSFFLLSSLILSSHRLDVCHTSTHDVVLVRI